MQSTTSNKPLTVPSPKLRQALIISVVLLLFSQVSPLPMGVRAIVALGLTIGWGVFAARWLVQRFGRPAVIILLALFIAVAGYVGIACWLDAPNRRLVAEIESMPGFYAAAGQGLIVGEVDHVYVNSTASEADVVRFTELSGLNDLRILYLNGPRVSDDTARKLGKLKSSWHLTLEDTGVSESVADELSEQLPNCRVKIKE